MRRLFWMGVGAVGAVVVAQRVRQTARRFTPEGVAEQAADAGRRTSAALQDAIADFKAARSAREQELVAALLVEPEGGSVADRRAAREGRDAWPPSVPGGPPRRTGLLDDDDEDDF